MLKQINKSKLSLAVASIAGVTLSGCSAHMVNETKDTIDRDAKEAQLKYDQGTKLTRIPTSVSVVNGMYISGSPVKMSDRQRLPAFFKSPIGVSRLDPMSFQEVIGAVSEEMNVRIELTRDALNHLVSISELASESEGDEGSSDGVLADFLVRGIDGGDQGLVGGSVKFTVQHEGTYESLMDFVTQKANLHWKWNGDYIRVYRTETKHFKLDFDMSGIAFNASVATASSSSGSSSQGGGASESSVESSHDITFSRETKDVNGEIVSLIQSMLSEKGTATVSPTLSTLTVTDTPLVIEDVEAFISEQNEIMGKRIAVRAKVYEIESDIDGNFGIDWSTLYRGSDRFSFDLATGLGGANDTPTLDLSILSDGDSRFQDTSALINMLNKNRYASLVTSSSVYTTNGRPVPVQIADEKHYLESVTSETDEDGNKSYEMTPGKVISGFSMTLVPRIDSNGDIQMEMAVDMSQLIGLDEFTVGGEEGNTIQLPNKTSKNFIQRVSIGSGQTLMMGGLERYERSAQTDSIAGERLWGLGGKKTGGKRKVMTLILLTPYIMAK